MVVGEGEHGFEVGFVDVGDALFEDSIFSGMRSRQVTWWPR